MQIKNVLPLLFASLMLAVRAADEPLVPQPLNSLLPGIHPGMTVHEVEAVLSRAYPKVSGQVSIWDGASGYVDYRLDDRFSLSVSSVNTLPDHLEPVVGTEVFFYVYDWPAKRRLELKTYVWADTNTVVARERSSAPPDPIDDLAAKLSADGGLWQNGLMQPVRLPETTPSEPLIKQILAMDQITNYTILNMRTVHIRGSIPDAYTAALIRTGPSEKIVLFNFGGPNLGWWHRIYDAVKQTTP
jgi:hypothetical protein